MTAQIEGHPYDSVAFSRLPDLGDLDYVDIVTRYQLPDYELNYSILQSLGFTDQEIKLLRQDNLFNRAILEELPVNGIRQERIRALGVIAQASINAVLRWDELSTQLSTGQAKDLGIDPNQARLLSRLPSIDFATELRHGRHVGRVLGLQEPTYQTRYTVPDPAVAGHRLQIHVQQKQGKRQHRQFTDASDVLTLRSEYSPRRSLELIRFEMLELAARQGPRALEQVIDALLHRTQTFPANRYENFDPLKDLERYLRNEGRDTHPVTERLMREQALAHALVIREIEATFTGKRQMTEAAIRGGLVFLLNITSEEGGFVHDERLMGYVNQLVNYLASEEDNLKKHKLPGNVHDAIQFVKELIDANFDKELLRDRRFGIRTSSEDLNVFEILADAHRVYELINQSRKEIPESVNHLATYLVTLGISDEEIQIVRDYIQLGINREFSTRRPTALYERISHIIDLVQQQSFEDYAIPEGVHTAATVLIALGDLSSKLKKKFSPEGKSK